jgi:hypothetical protein
MKGKRRWLVAPVLVAGLGSGVALASSSDQPPIPIVVETNPPPYTSPTGPVMSRADAARVAVALARSQDTQGGGATTEPTELTQMRGPFSKTEPIADPRAHIPDSPEMEVQLGDDTYLTVMHGHFTSQDVPHGAEPTRGTVMDVIAEAHTGSIEMVHIGQSAPSSTELTPVSTTEGEVLASVATVRRGVIEGRLVESTSPPPGFKSTTRPLVGWTVVVAKGKLSELTTQSSPSIVARVKTREGGHFALHMKPGTYIVAAVWHTHPPSVNDEICAGVHVKVRTARRSRVTVGCNGV